MTRSKGLLATAAAAAMLTATTASAAEPMANGAASLSVARAGTPARNSNALGAKVPRGTLISIGILVILVVIVLVSVGGDDSPSSP